MMKSVIFKKRNIINEKKRFKFQEQECFSYFGIINILRVKI
jgi:hypothetical protein